jgi:hypothetical protein
VRQLESSKPLLYAPFLNFLHFINPKAALSSSTKPPMIDATGNGFIAGKVIGSVKNIANGCRNSHNFLKREVASRLSYVLLAVAAVVSRAIDGVIGIPAAALSILTGGTYVSLNNLAVRALQATGIISDLYYCCIKFLNPLAGTGVNTCTENRLLT